MKFGTSGSEKGEKEPRGERGRRIIDGDDVDGVLLRFTQLRVSGPLSYCI